MSECRAGSRRDAALHWSCAVWPVLHTSNCLKQSQASARGLRANDMNPRTMSTRELIAELASLDGAGRAIPTFVGDGQSLELRPDRDAIVLRQLDIIRTLRKRRARVRQSPGRRLVNVLTTSLPGET